MKQISEKNGPLFCAPAEGMIDLALYAHVGSDDARDP